MPKRKTQTRFAYTFVEVLVTIAIIVILFTLILPNILQHDEVRITESKNNLHEIGIALQSYAEKYGAYPPAYTVDAAGKPLHSWRTLLLPFLDEMQLYEKIDLSKPWDNSVNAEAYKANPDVYSCSDPDLQPGKTAYLSVVSPNGVFRPTASSRLADITDKHDETLMVIEVTPGQTIHWMVPLDTDLKNFFGYGSDAKLYYIGGVRTLFVDGSIQSLSNETTRDQLRAMISIAGNDKVSN